MIKNADHVTIAVNDLPAAIEFFKLLNFIETHNVIIENEPFAKYMNIPAVKADHVTLVLYHGDKEAKPHFEIQLLHFYHPKPQMDPNIHRLDKYGYNHLCLAVDNIEEVIERLQNNNVKILSEILDFNNRKLVYFEGPNGIILELAELKKA
ncbi:VOC family protein [Legionella anisa]|uniref:Glyoxalase n=1 Tax=Legionella anisa TaxID=28082 RepID=A0AAX0WRF3_9GAMM|nr:VOC family protein [Legionella anisa]AWN75605.1 glyoxalase [Legionella anisa]KTC76397.1 putative lyase [Legionella anisa]MBN5934828.1 VOC family protein [Legionella anisa]MCW8424200.1 VOC family protein [Legionella anisa]MCW8446682.1 VOC family protein [Legionella anisa]